MLANATDNKLALILNLDDLNKSLNTKLNSFFGYQWKNENTLTISNGTKFYSYQIATKIGKTTQETLEFAENKTFDNTNENLAFTEQNNLFFFNKNKEKLQLLTTPIKI